MRVLVTGGAGDIGKVTARRLVQHGWEVRVLDRAPDSNMPGIEYVSGDITQYASVREAMRGCEAVVHLAALRGPSMASGPDLFHINVAGTFNVYEAAAAEGIRRVAQASSINAIGCAWKLSDVAPQYFPIDEDHPSSTDDPYSFSKQMVEEIGAYYWRRERISGVSFRFPAVYAEGHTQSEAYKQRQQAGRSLLDELLSLDDAMRQARLSDARQRALEFRAGRPLETPGGRRRGDSDDPLWAAYTFDRFNFWAFIDVRDAAQALVKSLSADYEGHHALFANAPHNWLDYDTRTLIRLFFPEVRQFKSQLSGSASLVSIDRARALIGFEPTSDIGES